MTSKENETDANDRDKTGRVSGSGWPSIEYELHDWDAERAGPISRTQLRRVSGPYEAAIPPCIAKIDPIPLSSDTLAVVEDATAEMARFDGKVGDRIAPLASVLLRSESAASSKIENLTASAKAIALAEIGDTRRSNASLIVANARATQAAVALADHLDGPAIVAMQEALLGSSNPAIVGKWREVQVWIGGSNYGPHHADFVPPHHRRVPEAIEDLVRFLRRDSLPALAQTAIAHAQFETIHPFPDGNGRTGRALIHALLRAKGVTTNITIPVSAGLLTNTGGYFDALTSYRNGDVEPIVEAMAAAAFTAIDNGGLLIEDLARVGAHWQERVKARKDSAVWPILDYLIAQPAVNWATLENTFGLGSGSVYRAIDHLVDAGVLEETSGRGWGRVWIAPEVLVALDEFAARTGRRDGP